MGWESIPGWFDYQTLYEDVADWLPPNGIAVEVGCWLGRSVVYLANALIRTGKPFNLFAVDNFAGSECDRLDLTVQEYARSGMTLEDRFRNNLADCGVAEHVHVVKSDSVRGASHFADGSIDFLFLDADHRHEAVKADIAAWFPKMKPNSWMAGHDVNRGDVEKAVKEAFGDDWKIVTPAQMAWLHVLPGGPSDAG